MYIYKLKNEWFTPQMLSWYAGFGWLSTIENVVPDLLCQLFWSVCETNTINVTQTKPGLTQHCTQYIIARQMTKTQ